MIAKKNYSVFFISDRTGITTEEFGNALLSQFAKINFNKTVIPFVDNKTKVELIITKLKNFYTKNNEKPIVITSIISQDIKDYFKLDFIIHIDLFSVFIPILEKELGQLSSPVVGKTHGISNKTNYYKRVDAIDYAIHNDDGMVVDYYDESDVILIGVSRVGKTPTSIYLAVNYGIKSANYPLTSSDLKANKLSEKLLKYRNKLFGLTINKDRLHYIRNHRLPYSQYSNLNTCSEEITKAESIMYNYNIPFINTSNKSIEEIATEIMQNTNLKRQF